MSTREFLDSIALSIGKQPKDVDAVVNILVDNWYETVDSLREIDDETWKSLKIPGRLLGLIKDNLGQGEV